MRITGGIAKGQQLKLPKNYPIRPTTDRVREAIFSILAYLANHWSRGLDLYAGSGALGIEALSRDAKWVDFVEQESKCCATIKQNLEKVGLKQNSHVYCCSVAKALTFLIRKCMTHIAPFSIGVVLIIQWSRLTQALWEARGQRNLW